MINDIQDAFVDFPTSIFLRKKGFDVPCDTHWEWGNGDKKLNRPEGVFIGGFLDSNQNYRPYRNSELMSTYTDEKYPDCIFGEFSRPTHSVAIDWIKENLKVAIGAQISASGFYMYDIWKWKGGELGWEWVKITYGSYKTKNEALDAALKYTIEEILENVV